MGACSPNIWVIQALRLRYQGLYTLHILYIVKGIGKDPIHQIRSICQSLGIYSTALAPLLEVIEPCHKEKLLQEEFRVQDGDVGGSTDQGVGRVG